MPPAGHLHFAETYEVIAEDPALVLQAFVDADRDLSGESVAASQDGRADHGGKFGIDQGLAAHDHEAAIEFGIVAGMMNAIDFAPSHRPWLRLSLLIAEDVLHFFVQFIRGLIDEFEIASFNLSPRLLAEVSS